MVQYVANERSAFLAFSIPDWKKESSQIPGLENYSFNERITYV